MREFVKYSTMVVLGVLLAAFLGCNESSTNPSARTGNLLMNGSFERDGQPNLDGWAGPRDSSTVSFADDAAPGGGQFSLQLETGFNPNVASATVGMHGTEETGVYRLSAYVRSIGYFGGGGIELVPWPDSQTEDNPPKWAASSDSSWTLLSVVDTIGSCDSLSVLLWSNWGPNWLAPVPLGYGRFDGVVLERVDE
jgi:hypothetical protein